MALDVTYTGKESRKPVSAEVLAGLAARKDAPPEFKKLALAAMGNSAPRQTLTTGALNTMKR